MLARSYEDLEKRLHAQLKELDISHNGAEFKPDLDRSKCSVESEADNLSLCSCDNIPVIVGEHEEKTGTAK